MSGPAELSAGRHRVRPWTLLRPLLTGVVLLAVYYALPLERGGAPVVLVVGLVVLGALLVWQLRAVVISPSPRLRAVEALATSIPLYVLLFAGAYTAMSAREPGAFTEPVDRTDALYFTVATLATVGFGDIAAVSQPARVVVTVQMVTGLVLLGLVIQVFLGAVRISLRHAAGGPGAPPGDDGEAPRPPG
ncbi:two pore domain potassium channel family protein [Georgenia wutianyii]|uniref:Two pore domain potassium channel family protein n=1 Tax=Georgenia wutianyii TaxID=2585135 RepID=A0ABX5VJG8_9MICO|nr:potassium channel family protein [Georgenia wutianyii]QDB78228.1 two pore domain potassium channel family protein [Georgenia wutianyii]